MKKLISLIISILFLTTVSIFPQEKSLPVDKEIIQGTLDNGVKYYIKKNSRPENRAELRLFIKAGSVLEDDNQAGLAHFVEHMAFNGTKNFKKNELINYLEKLGIKFGPELNASTGFDQTIYKLTVPTDDAEILAKGFFVLEEWAHNLAFDPEEIDKERGVVIEEWRLGRGAEMRMLDKQLPIIFKGSKYAERLPIGKKEIVESADYETIKKFYYDWYRPDLFAVAAVGDFDVQTIENYIKDHFGGLQSPENKRAREDYNVPDHQETYFAIASDKEARYTTVQLIYTRDPIIIRGTQDYRNKLIHDIFYGILNDRLSELTSSQDPPFTFAYTGSQRAIKTAELSFLAALVKEGDIEKGFEALLREAERVQQFGFTQGELDRQKNNTLRVAEKNLAEKDKTESGSIIGEIADNYLYDEPLLSAEDKYNLAEQLLPSITLGEVNAVSAELLKRDNRVVLVNSPEREGLKVPGEGDLTPVITRVGLEKITPYADVVTDKPLVENVPTSSPVVKSEYSENLGITKWTLKNGVKVVLKPTDFKNDEVIFSAFSPGGSSHVANEDFLSAQLAADMMNESGLGAYSNPELTKYLKGKIVNVNPYIDFYFEGLNGGASTKDLEIFFQLIYTYFTSPRIDSTGYLALKSKIKSFLENRSNDPEAAFNDTLQVTLANYHFRSRPLTVKMLDEINPVKSLAIYKDRFKDAGDFTFIFVGNIDTVSYKPLVETYLGGLPSYAGNEKPIDLKYRDVRGMITKEVKRGIEPKSMVAVSYVGDMDWSRKNAYMIQSLTDILNIKLRESIREEKGGTYGVRCYNQIYRIPQSHYSINFKFGCNPDRVDELVGVFNNVLDSIKTFGPDEAVMTKIKETQKRQRELNLKENRFWNGILYDYLQNNEDPEDILNYYHWVEELTADDIKNCSNMYLGDNIVKIVLYPEEKEEL